MKNCWRLIGSTLIVMICWTANTWAETRYISDQLIVTLREQPQAGAQSITHLKTDEPVEVIEETGAFVKVKTKAGEIGYIKQNYLTPETPKTTIIEQLQRERDRLTDKVAQVQQQVATATSRGNESQQELVAQLTASENQVNELKTKLEESQAALTRTSKDYQALQKDTTNVVAIAKERDQLRITNQELTAAVAKLEEEVENLTMTGIIKWFLAGAGVLVLGWMIGKFSGRRRARF